MMVNAVSAHTGGAKTQLLREYFEQNPDASSKQGAEAVGTSWAYASQVKHHGSIKAARAKGKERRRGFGKGSKGSKRQAIAEFFKANPDATVTQAVEALGGSASYVSKVKNQGKGHRKLAARKKAAAYPDLVTQSHRDFPVNASDNGAMSHRSERKAVGSKPLEMAIGIPDDGVLIRFDRRGRVIGTLLANTENVQFVRAHGRKGSLRSTISWDRLANLFESGIL
jgi:hypothetical protein